MTGDGKYNLLDFGVKELIAFFAELGEKPYRATQVIKWIHQQGVTDFAAMTNLSQALRQQLAECAFIALPQVRLQRRSADGTCKWLLTLHDGNVIETVFIPERERGTLCVSSQVGCALNCSFCATGKEGFNRNLTHGEIIGQVWLAVRHLQQLGERVTNVVMMGMGEPLLNYDAVVSAMDLMLCDNAYGLSKYRVTLSTSGVVPAMRQLQQDSPVALAVSLHAANNTLRNQLVPLNKKYPLEVLIPVCREYFPAGSRRSVTFEYVMLSGVNDHLGDAQQLITLLAGMNCKINLIPFNSFAGTHYQCASDAVIERFRQQLCSAGLNAWTRKTRGDDIAGACGQLAGEIRDRTGRNNRWIRTGKLVPEVVN